AHLQQQANNDLPTESTVKLSAMVNKQGALGRTTNRKAAQLGSTTTGINKMPPKTYYDARHQPFPDAVVTIH
ncbi:unnamed protein product, partial [Rotaria magnacalcarata]